jgi:hypothetical protein
MTEKIILENENIKIVSDNLIFKIQFNFTAYSLINSLLKSRIIIGGSTDETYKTILFKANSVKTLDEYKISILKSQGKKSLSIPDLANMIHNLTSQLDYLINKESCTIMGYNPTDIIVINDEKFAFIGNELISNINVEDNETTIISYPFTVTDFFVSPELLNIKEIPSKVHYKTAYFSLGILLIYVLLDDDEFYVDYVKQKKASNIIDALNSHSIKDTRIYWLLSRCLIEEPIKRSIILL